MASRFYWYGRGSAKLLTLDCEPDDLQVVREVLADGAAPAAGRPARVQYGIRHRVTVSIPALEATDRSDFTDLVGHLQAGGAVGFARDPDRATLAWVTNPIPAGSVALSTSGGSQMLAWEPSAALVSGDRLLIQSANPEGRVEEVTFGSVTSFGVVTLSSGVRGRFDGTPVAVRPWGFFPVLTLDPDADVTFTSDRELYYDVVLPLVEHPAHLLALRSVTLGGTSTPHVAPLAASLDQAIGLAPGPSGTLAARFRTGATLR